MYDTGKILIGIAVFVLFFTLPLWLLSFSGKGGIAPQIQPVTKAKQCVLPKEDMLHEHMHMLNVWRDEVVRQAKREVTINGQHYQKSLSRACLNCHQDKSRFCDRCHNYLSVTPYCWDCHIDPAEVK